MKTAETIITILAGVAVCRLLFSGKKRKPVNTPPPIVVMSSSGICTVVDHHGDVITGADCEDIGIVLYASGIKNVFIDPGDANPQKVGETIDEIMSYGIKVEMRSQT